MEMKLMINEIISTYKGEDIDLCYEVLRLLKDKTREEQINGIEEFFESVGCTESDKTKEITKNVDIERLEKINKVYSTYVKEMITAIIMKAHLLNWEKEKVYNILIDELYGNTLLEEMDVKAFSLLVLAQSDLLPYFCIGDSIKMENDEFQEITKNNIKSIKIQQLMYNN